MFAYGTARTVQRAVHVGCFCIAVGASSVSLAEPPSAPVPASVQQLVLVRAASWSASTGSLQRYERDETSSWHAVGELVHVSLGRHGLAWGRGLHPDHEPGPTKREGDGRSPAGVFTLDRAFGAADALPDGSHDFAYFHARRSSYCVEDVHSTHYNELVDSSEVKPPGWERWSALRRSDGLFRWGIVVHQNAPDVVAGAGSCVFLHIWRGKHRPTAGCTAMPAESIEEILRWLDAKAHPVLVQLPETVFRNVRTGWGLPDDSADSSEPN